MVKKSVRSAKQGAAVFALLAASLVCSAATQPAVPPTLCVNGKCTNSPTNVAAGIKWHPGHYLDGSTFTPIGNTFLSTKVSEANLVRNSPSQVMGYEQYYWWRTLEEGGPGVYDFSSIDTDYVNITGYVSGKTTGAVYNAPRRFAFYIVHTDYFSSNPANRVLPDYLLNNPLYGAGADGQHTGYWTTTGAQGQGTGSVVAFWRPTVMARMQALMAALANHALPDGYTIDSSPYVEWVKAFVETCDDPANPVSPAGNGAADGGADPTFTMAGYLAQLEALNLSMAAAFPHTSYATTANFLPDAQSLVSLVQSFAASRSGESGPDTFGYSSGQNVCVGLCGLTWGQAAYIGLKPPASGNPWSVPWVTGGLDLRGVVPAILTVECTEMVSDCGAHYTPNDLYQQANTTLHATHMAWSYVIPGQFPHGTADVYWFGTASGQSTWSVGSGGVLATIVNSPLTNTACPRNYLSGCNTN